jgi:DDE_Tnp_1-associated
MTQSAPPPDWLCCFSAIADPRREQGTYHALRSIIGIALLAVLCGANDWATIAAYGEEQADWLGTFLSLPCGPPSADTFERVFQRIDPVAFELGFRQWVAQIIEPLGVKVVALDGKTHRGSYDCEHQLKALHTGKCLALVNIVWSWPKWRCRASRMRLQRFHHYWRC